MRKTRDVASNSGFPAIFRLMPARNLPANISKRFRISITAKLSSGDMPMRFRKREPLFSILLDTGLHVLDSLRERVPDHGHDIKDKVHDTYDTATRRVSRAADALRGEEDLHILGKVGALLIGIGIGVGVGLLIAPASGGETRAEITDKVPDLGDKARKRSGEKPQGATGTHGE